ncbi:MAG: lamin tail domain-containing protein [Luteolibacter sp.]
MAITSISVVSARDSVVVFNEVHYHPQGNDASLEYVEIYNQMAVNVDLSNWRIDGDIEFDFPEGTVIGGREYLVIAKDPDALMAASSISSVVGSFSGSLSNSGGTILLYKNNRAFSTLAGSGSDGSANPSLEGRRIMDRLEYSDVTPWPVAPDGSGFALAKLDPGAGSALPKNWATSGGHLGTPGSMNVFAPSSSLTINEVSGSLDANFQIEIYNSGSSAEVLDGLVLASSDPLRADYVFPIGNLENGEYAVLGVGELGYTPTDNERLFLMSAGKVSLIDSVRVDDRPQARFPDGIGSWSRPDAPTFLQENSVTLRDEVVINEIFYNAPSQREVPPLLNESILQVVDYDHVWRYNLDAGTAGLPAGWATNAHVVDGTSWAQGQGLLGVENTTLNEPLRTTMTLTSQVTYYFETEFVYDGTEAVFEMIFNHYTDDGAVFYLNGKEIERFNMDEGSFDASTLTNPGVGNASLQSFSIEAPELITGSNRLSVEVHQTSTGSSDVVFGTQIQLKVTENAEGSNGVPFMERDEEWLELYNRSASAVDLSEWQLDGGIEYEFPHGTIIPAYGYLVVAEDAVALSAKHPSVNIIGNYDGKLANGGERILLEDSVGNLADEVTYYDSGKWHGFADGGGSSLELKDPDADNSAAGAWAASNEVSRNSWQTYTYEGIAFDDGIGLSTFNELQMGLLDAGEFLIDDISVLEEDTNEFLQNGDFEADSIGSTPDKWRVLGTHGSHGRTVVVVDPDDPGNKCLRVVSTGNTENKHNKIETTFANGEEVVEGNRYRISYRSKFVGGSNQLNSRLYFNYLQRTTILDTPTVWGTPGVQNSVWVSNDGPALQGLSHSPVVPDANQAVTVGVAVSDADGIGSVILNYSVNDGAFQTVTMSLDAEGRYTGIIPGQAASANVRFYVSANDVFNATSLYPASGVNGGAFYKVQDGLADTTGLRHNFRIVMAESDRQFLFESTNRMSNDRMPVTVIENGTKVYYDAGLRLKASAHGRNQSSGYGFNIAFQPDFLFRGVHSSISIERGGRAQTLFSKQLSNRSGTPYTSSYDDVAYIINPIAGNSAIGLLHMARHSSVFFDGIHPEDSDQGDLFNLELHYSPTTTTDGDPESLKVPQTYSNVNGRYDLKGYGSDKETIRWGFQKRSARDRDDYSRIIDLNDVFELDGEAFANALDQVADVDQWIRVFAMMSLNGTDDVFSRIWEHNFRFYVRPDGKVVVMQWDLDRAFRLSTSDASTILPTVNGVGDPSSIAKLFTIPRFERLFYGHVDDLINTTFNSTYLAPWATELASVSGTSMNSYLNYVTNRADLVDNILPASISFEISTNGGNDFSTEASSTELEGDAWVDVVSISVNGIDVPVTWTDANSWLITSPLSIGQNSLVITAYNQRGVEVGSDTITITNTSDVDLASAVNLAITELHYHPSDPGQLEVDAGFTDSDQFEFIEVTNTDLSVYVDLTGVRFTNGVTYSFPASTVVAPGESVVLVSDQTAFEFRYGSVSVIGVFTGNLRNSGETIRLEAADGSVIAEFSYGDVLPWPTSADGDGYSLVFIGEDLDSATDWRSSVAVHGTPNGDDSITYTGGDMVSYSVLGEPEFIVQEGATVFSFDQILGADAVMAEPVFSSDFTNWIPGDESMLLSSGNNGDGTVRKVYQVPPVLQGSPKVFGRMRVMLR